MKNAIVVAVGKTRWAVELRWVRDVITLGHVTPVPRAPAAIAGVVNLGGAIVPVLEIEPVTGGGGDGDRRPAARGDSAVLVQVESIRAAIRVDTVVEVATMREGDDGGWHDAAGVSARLLDPSELIGGARAQVAGIHEAGQ